MSTTNSAPTRPAISLPPSPDWRFEPVDLATLPGWGEDDQAAALAAFRLSAERIASAPPKMRRFGISAEAVSRVASLALRLPAHADTKAARRFFEAEFAGLLVRPASGDGFFTGYYEPEVEGSLVRTARFQTPLYRRPADLVDIDDGNRPAGLDPSIRFARQAGGRIEAYPDRGAIESGLLAGKGLELVWLEDPIDAFFIHIQGSARISLADGGTMRVSFAAKSGHAYTPIGRVLIELGELERGTVTMEAIRGWLNANPGRMSEIMWQNRSFIFFQEVESTNPRLGPVAAAGVQLTPGRSLAVDRELHTFHLPLWIETRVPEGRGFDPFRRLMVAQDTGSAIVGPARGDIFFGSGAGPAAIAGAMAASGRMVLLVPREPAKG